MINTKEMETFFPHELRGGSILNHTEVQIHHISP